ncbi:MAG: hypothetical protein GY754_02370 [bacterium]|nr:hypothetical protein [bacterium]
MNDLSKQEINNRVRTIVSESARINVDILESGYRLADLQLNSKGIAGMYTALENTFDVEFLELERLGIKTIDNLVYIIMRHRETKKSNPDVPPHSTAAVSE